MNKASEGIASKKRKRSFASNRCVFATSFMFTVRSTISASSMIYKPFITASLKNKCLVKNRDALAFVTPRYYTHFTRVSERVPLFGKNSSKIGPTEHYLNMMSEQRDQDSENPNVNGDVDGDTNLKHSINGFKNPTPVEDDDYAMSFPIPKSHQVINGEEEIKKDNASSMDGEVVLNVGETLENVEQNVTVLGTDQPPRLGALIRNFLASKDDEDGENREEESRRWSEWMTTGKKTRPSSSSDSTVSDVAPAAESAPPKDNAETPAAGAPAEAAEVPVAPTEFLAKLKQQSKKKKSQLKQQQKQRKQEQEEKQQIERKQKQREESSYREQRDKDPGRISASDWSHNILNIPSSRILKDIRSPVLFSCIWATLWSVLYKNLIALGESANKNAADLARRAASAMIIPTTAHSVMISAMSLLLVFRTNSAYQRFAEGRKIWEDIVSTSRDFSRMVKLYEFAIGTSKCRRINLLIASFPYLLRHRIRPSLLQMKKVNDPSFVRDPENSLLLYPDVSMKDTDPEIAALAYDEEETGASRRKTRELCWVDKRNLPWKLLPGTALDLCARAQNRPLWVVDRMAKELCVVQDLNPMFTNRERMALLAYTDKLSRTIGACERIHQTVVPLNYARHALRSVTVWLWTLPFALMKDFGLGTGPMIAIIAWILFGVYEIGTRIEDPFQGTLRLSIYCDAIRRDVLADAIVRDTAFELDYGETKVAENVDGDEDAIFEFESESDEYDDGDEVSPAKKKKKAKNIKESKPGFRITDYLKQ